MSDQILRVITHLIPWTNPEIEKPSRELRWRAELDGEVLVENSKRPYEDAAAALINAGHDENALYTMRHADQEFDSFTPGPLRIPAAPALKRAESMRKFKEKLDAQQAD